ncbi:MAG: ABC transporter permease subunit [Candidatus Anstonellaceae archaeon]
MKNLKSSLAVIFLIIFIPLLAFTYFGLWQEALENQELILLPYFVFRSLVRMAIAYFFVIVFGLAYGIVAGLYRKPRLVMLPLLDILQSIPVLGYLPPAILLFSNSLPGYLGYEIASIFLIFSGMAWSVTFSVLGAVRSIPNDIREASDAFGLRGWKYVRHVVFPAIFPSFVTGSVLAWGGGWYFLVAAEMLSYGSSVHILPGIGSFLGSAVFTYGNIPSAILGLAVFVAVVFAINSFVWKPLSDYSKYFNLQTTVSEGTQPPSYSDFGPIIHLISAFQKLNRKYGDLLDNSIDRFFKPYAKILRFLEHVPRKRRKIFHTALLFGIYLTLFALVMSAFAFFVAAALSVLPPSDFLRVLENRHELQQLPILGVYSLARIFIAYIIALSWTLAAGILIARSERLYSIFMPIFDIGQSTPALALFPFIVSFIISMLGGNELSVNIAAILLLLTGSQWYLLFNIVGAVKSIPGNILEASRAFGVRGWNFYLSIIIPSIIPGILLGSIQAWGGAWNALIVSEYINYAGQTYSVPGLGSFLTEATLEPNPEPWVITMAVATMSTLVLLMNYLVWRPLFNYAERFRFENV